MKRISVSKLQAGVIFLMMAALVFAGCSTNNNDEAKNVRDYNNAIVATQEEMLANGNEGADTLNGQTLSVSMSLAQFQKIQGNIKFEYNKFSTLKVPKGAEDLSASMKSFFDVETSGIQNIINALSVLEQNQNDPQALENLNKASDDFSRNESNALANFGDVQKKVAAKYNETIQQNTQSLF